MNCQQKGKNFERKVAKILTEKLCMEFNRTPQSGGLRWASDNNVYGDIVTPDNFPFIIECKNRENWSFDQFMKGECKEFDSWVEQVIEDCNRHNKNNEEKLPLIIFTKNRMPIYVASPVHLDCVRDSYVDELITWETVSMIYKDWYINKLEE